MNKLIVKLREKKGALVTGAVVAASGAGVASAQTTTEGGAGINYAGMIGSVQSGMVATVNGAGPSLFGFVAVIGGFYFVWGRIRSLW